MKTKPYLLGQRDRQTVHPQLLCNCKTWNTVEVSSATIETQVLGDNRLLTCQRHLTDIRTSQQPLLTARSTIWRRRVTHNKWFDHAMYTCNKFHGTTHGVRFGFDSIEVSTPTHALHNVRRRLIRNQEHFAICNHDWASNATTPQCQAERALMIRSHLDDHSTMSGGGRYAIENGFESPKHRDSLGLLMNSYVHRGHYTHAQWNTKCFT